MGTKTIKVDKFGSATARLRLPFEIKVSVNGRMANSGDVVVVKALSESVTYGNLELPSGRLAKINRNDILTGVFGKRRALKGFVGDIPARVKAGDKLHLLNMGGLIGECKGHHSQYSDAIEVEVVGVAVDSDGDPLNISSNALDPAQKLGRSAPIIVVAGSSMHSGKTVAACEIIKQANQAGLNVAGAKMSGVAALRDTYNMLDHGASNVASFLDCGLPSTVDVDDLAPVAKAILNHLNESVPDLIVVELGDGILGGYSVETILKDEEIRDAMTSLVFCASDYVGIVGGKTVLNSLGLNIDVAAGSVTDAKMGEDYVRERLGIMAANAHRNGEQLFFLCYGAVAKVRPMPMDTTNEVGVAI
jgi:hypothetical protein